jgi:hypothetical protein
LTKRTHWLLHAIIGCSTFYATAFAADPVPPNLAKPVEKGRWIIPANSKSAEPIWGIKGGIHVGLWPTKGPRGLLRIYAPYLDQPPQRVVNFIAVEPIASDKRGFSELERSKLDNLPGLAMWTADDFDADPKPRKPWQPALGKITGEGRSESLSFHLFTERFENGAHAVIKVTLRQDRPYEVALAAYPAKESAPMKTCILTATMGNYGRLRDLWLKDEIIRSTKLYADSPIVHHGFYPHRHWGPDRILKSNGDFFVAVTSDEPDPASTNGPNVPRPWRYVGKPATHYWKTSAAAPPPLVRVNARRTYWPDQTGSANPIPGGVSYENFELDAPFQPGREFRFGVTVEKPEAMGFIEKG